MKRAILVGGGTLAGVAAVLALNPDAASTARMGVMPTPPPMSTTRSVRRLSAVKVP